MDEFDFEHSISNTNETADTSDHEAVVDLAAAGWTNSAGDKHRPGTDTDNADRIISASTRIQPQIDNRKTPSVLPDFIFDNRLHTPESYVVSGIEDEVQ